MLAVPALCQPKDGKRYILVLHGKIAEEMGADAANNTSGFGPYKYEDVLQQMRAAGFEVLTEYRKRNTDVQAYAKKVAHQVDSLMKRDVPPGNITVIGMSKGAAIAMYASTYLHHSGLNFVFMSCCNNYTESEKDIKFCGNILSIYEESDVMGQSCKKLKERSTLAMPHYKEVKLQTGLQHGYFYLPRKEWLQPALRWANGEYE